MKKGLYSGNNVLALLTIILIIFSVWSFWVTDRYVQTTGKAAFAYAKFCYEVSPPKLVFDYPYEGEVVSGVYTIRSRTEPDPGALNFTKFYLESGAMRTLLGNTTLPTWGYYNFIFNSSKFSDKNCAYKIYGRANFSSCTTYGEEWSGEFTINNVNVQPTWSNFRNNLTTNFSRFSSWVALENVTVGRPNKGVLDFENKTVNLDGANLNSLLSFQQFYFQIGTIPCITTRLSTIRPTITFLNMTYRKPQIYRSGAICPSASCTIERQTNNSLTVRLKRNGAATYQLVEGSYVVLSIMDDTDGEVNYYVGQPVTFYANLTDVVTGREVHGSGVYCLINFDLDYEEDENFDMVYNPTSRLYEYTRTFLHPNQAGYNDDWGVFCNATVLDMEEAGWLYSKFTIPNRGPVLVADYPNETWAWNSILTGRNLADYFVDPDNDPLNFSIQADVDHIYIDINGTTNVVVFIPSTDWYGNRTVIFVATDTFNASANSNDVHLEVVKVPVPIPPPERPSLVIPEQAQCKPNWMCGNWSDCKPSGIKTRECTDLNYCNLSIWVPETVMNCTYIPTCFDSIKNGNESGVDCGGKCGPCPTCKDGIKNQGELGLDCGGPCYPCPSCFDGMKNQGVSKEEKYKDEQGIWTARMVIVGGETGIDCGGPCEPCPTCADGIKNGDEEGVDCGGELCIPCEKAFSLERPRMSKAFWSIFIISLSLATAITVLIRHQLYSIIAWLGLLVGKMASSRKKSSLMEAYLPPYLEFMASLQALKSDALLELKEVADTFFVFFFGDHPAVKLPVVMSSQDYFPEGLVSELKNLHRELFIRSTEIGFIGLLKSAREGIRGAFLQSFISSGESYEGIFHALESLFQGYLKTDPELAAILKEELYHVYLKLPIQDKGKVYKKLREIDRTEVRQIPDTNSKLLVLLVVFGLMGIIGVVIGPSLTGYVGLDLNGIPLQIKPIPDADLQVGAGFTQRVVAEGGVPPLSYYDDSEYFKIDPRTGEISIIPGHHTIGRNFATITVVDGNGTKASAVFKFTVHT